MQLIINVVITFFLSLGFLFAALPGAFGLNNFNSSHAEPFIFFASTAWFLLLISHPYTFYKIWIDQPSVYWWLLLPIILQIVFFTFFGKNVSTEF